MLERILKKVKGSYPYVKIYHAPGRMRDGGIVYRFHPSRSKGERKSARLVMKFFGETLADAMGLYSDVRDLIVSRADESRVGEGIHALSIEEVAEGGASGYVSKTGLYYVQAGFFVVGY